MAYFKFLIFLYGQERMAFTIQWENFGHPIEMPVIIWSAQHFHLLSFIYLWSFHVPKFLLSMIVAISLSDTRLLQNILFPLSHFRRFSAMVFHPPMIISIPPSLDERMDERKCDNFNSYDPHSEGMRRDIFFHLLLLFQIQSQPCIYIDLDAYIFTYLQ